VLAVMVWSGLLIYWAYPAYQIQIGGTTLIKFFPNWFFSALKLRRRLAEGMAWHFAFMWIFTAISLLYLLYTLLSGHWRVLLPSRRTFRDAWAVVLHDLGLRSGAPASVPYNAAQQIAYSGTLLMSLGLVLTGLAIYKPTQFAGLTWLLGGYQTARLLHFALTVGYVLFFVIHLVQVVRAGWNTFQSMITGFEVVPEPNQPLASNADANPTA